MWRVILNCLLLATIVSAVPNDRHKRHLAFIKDLITSTLFGETQTTIVEPQAEYKLYRVPGFNDVLVKSSVDLPKKATKIIKPGKEVLEIHPFEAYIGTENEEDTITVFENVHNLLSTGVLTRQQSKLMQETIGPMISGVNALEIVGKERIRPVEIVSKTVQPILTETILPKEVKVFSDSKAVKVKTAPVMCETIPPELTEVDASVKLEVPVKPRYLFTQMEKSRPLKTFSQLGPKLSVRRKVDASPVLPMCIKQRIDEAVSIGTIPHRTVAITGGSFLDSHDVAVEPYPYDVKRFPSPGPHESNKVRLLQQPIHVHASRKTVAQEIVSPPPVIHYVQPKHIPASSKSIKNVYDITTDKSETVKVNNASVVKSLKTDKETAVKESKDGIVSHYRYRQVSNNKPQVPNILKENDKLNTLNHVKTSPVLSSTPKVINYVNVAKNNNSLKTSGTASTHKPVSNYVYKQISHNNTTTGFHIAKEKEESNDTPFSNKYSPTTSTLGTTPKLTNSVNFNKNTEPVLNGSKNEFKDKSVLNYVYKQVNHGNSNIFSIAKESDKVDSHSSLPTNIVVAGSNTKKTTDNIARTNDIGPNVVKSPDSGTVDQTLSQYIYKELGHNNPPAFSIFENKDEVKSKVNTDSSFSKNYVYVSPNVDSVPPIKLDHNENNKGGRSNNAEKDKTLSQYIDEQISHHLSHTLGTIEKKNELRTTDYIPPVIGKAPILNAPIRSVPVAKTVQTPEVPISQFVYKQVNLNNQNVFSMLKEGDKVKTNIITNAVPVDYTTAKVDDVKDSSIQAVATSSKKAIEGARKGILGISPVLKENNKVKTNIITESVPAGYTTAKVDDVKDFSIEAEASSSERATEGARKGILGVPPVLKESDKKSFKDNPIVVADLDSNYRYHQSNIDGSLVSVKGNREGVAINEDRGDIRK